MQFVAIIIRETCDPEEHMACGQRCGGRELVYLVSIERGSLRVDSLMSTHGSIYMNLVFMPPTRLLRHPKR